MGIFNYLGLTGIMGRLANSVKYNKPVSNKKDITTTERKRRNKRRRMQNRSRKINRH